MLLTWTILNHGNRVHLYWFLSQLELLNKFPLMNEIQPQDNVVILLLTQLFVAQQLHLTG